MASKKKGSFDGVKIKKKEPKIVIEEVKEVEKAVETVVEEEISNAEVVGMTKSSGKVIGDVGGSIVRQPKGRIRFEAQVAPVPMFKIPYEIRQYLVSHGFSTDVWKKDKEWLEKHHADPVMIEKLKDFLTGEK